MLTWSTSIRRASNSTVMCCTPCETRHAKGWRSTTTSASAHSAAALWLETVVTAVLLQQAWHGVFLSAPGLRLELISERMHHLQLHAGIRER